MKSFEWEIYLVSLWGEFESVGADSGRVPGEGDEEKEKRRGTRLRWRRGGGEESRLMRAAATIDFECRGLKCDYFGDWVSNF